MASDIIYEREIEPAEWFLVARAKALRKPNALEIICKHESPDFILRNRVQKRRLGLEVTDARQQMSRSDIELREEILRMEPPWADFYFDEVCRLVSQKEVKRALPQWKYPHATVLLIRLHYSIVEMARFLDGLSTDGGRPAKPYSAREMRNLYLPENGFREIWLQDVEPTFWKDGDIIESAVYNLQPWWGRRYINSLHRQFAIFEGNRL